MNLARSILAVVARIDFGGAFGRFDVSVEEARMIALEDGGDAAEGGDVDPVIVGAAGAGTETGQNSSLDRPGKATAMNSSSPRPRGRKKLKAWGWAMGPRLLSRAWVYHLCCRRWRARS